MKVCMRGSDFVYKLRMIFFMLQHDLAVGDAAADDDFSVTLTSWLTSLPGRHLPAILQ